MTATRMTYMSMLIGPSVASTLLASGEVSFPCLPSHAVRNIVLVYIGDVLGSFPAYQLSRCYLDVAKPLVGVVAHIFRQRHWMTFAGPALYAAMAKSVRLNWSR